MADLASRITKPDGEAADAPAPADNAAAAATAPAAAEGQTDGAVEAEGGSGLNEPDYEVEVSLSALQENQATPFHSATTWQDLGLYVTFSLLESPNIC